MKSNALTPYPEEISKSFIKRIIQNFEQLFSDSPDHPIFIQCYYSSESYHLHRKYRWYRLKTRTRMKLAPSGSSSPPPPLSKAAFTATYFPPTEQQLLDAGLAGLHNCLTDCFPYSCTLYHPIEKRFHLLCSLRMESPVDRAFREYYPEKDSDYWEEFEGSAEWISEDGDRLLLLYKFVFMQIKQAGLDWKYRSAVLADTKRLEEFREDDSKLEFLSDIGVSRNNQEEDSPPTDPDDIPRKPPVTFEEAYYQALRRGTPSAVEAYRHVYGHLPDGYPPRIDEY